MSEPRWVLPEVVHAIHKMLIAEHGGLPGIRDQGLLDSALARPRQQAAYKKNNSIFQLAAAYSYGLARNHPFADGNKRIALTVAAVFLEINGHSLNAPEAEAALIYQQLADGTLTEQALAEWIREWSV
ncbi:MAG: type II toxin-antitoxin system death-on-curing family toxin [Betaproteobacteria bacterium]